MITIIRINHQNYSHMSSATTSTTTTAAAEGSLAAKKAEEETRFRERFLIAGMNEPNAREKARSKAREALDEMITFITPLVHKDAGIHFVLFFLLTKKKCDEQS